METIKLTVALEDEKAENDSTLTTLLMNQLQLLMSSSSVIIGLIALAIAILTVTLSRIYFKLTCGMCKCARRLDGKVVLITGATSGIGKETARDLYNRGATVILAVRSIQRGLDAVNQIKEKTNSPSSSSINYEASTKHLISSTFSNDGKCSHSKIRAFCTLESYSTPSSSDGQFRHSGQLIVKHCDLASLSSVRAFVADVLKCFKTIDILILNAGMVPPLGKHLSVDGYEMQFQCNHLSHFLMINLLLPRLISNSRGNSEEPVTNGNSLTPSDQLPQLTGPAESTSDCRIIVVSSMLHSIGFIDFENLNFEKKTLDPAWQYAMTKLANILTVKELARKLQKLKVPITVNSLHPGLVRTSINRNTPWYIKHFMQPILYKLWAKNAFEGAQTTIYLAVSPEVKNVSGLYFSDCKVVKSSDASNDQELATKLWSVSEELCGLSKTKQVDGKSAKSGSTFGGANEDVDSLVEF